MAKTTDDAEKGTPFAFRLYVLRTYTLNSPTTASVHPRKKGLTEGGGHIVNTTTPTAITAECTYTTYLVHPVCVVGLTTQK